MVSVIDEQAIQEMLVQDFADLVKYEPGVYVENNVTRLGLNGFNIPRHRRQPGHDAGGRRADVGAVRLRAVQRPSIGTRRRRTEVGRDRAERELGAVRQRRPRRRRVALHQGSGRLPGRPAVPSRSQDDLGRPVRRGSAPTCPWPPAPSGSRAPCSRASTAATRSATRAPWRRPTTPARHPIHRMSTGCNCWPSWCSRRRPATCCAPRPRFYDTRIETEWLSDQGLVDLGFLRYQNTNSNALDTQDRMRLSIDQTLVDRGLDQFSWRVYGQFSDTSQVVDRERMTFGFGPPLPSLRHGTVDHEQGGYGLSGQGQKWLGDPDGGVLITAGAGYTERLLRHALRDRSETHAITGAPIPTRLIFPSKYFPDSTVVESGAYLQAELQFGRLSLVPGVRYDYFSLDANQGDPVFIASLNPEAADFSDAALSPKLGMAVQLSGGRDRPRAVLPGVPSAAPQRHQHRVHQPAGRLHDASEPRPASRDQPERRGRHPRRPGTRKLRDHRLLQPVRRVHRVEHPRLQPADATAGVPEPEPGRGADLGGRVARGRRT